MGRVTVTVALALVLAGCGAGGGVNTTGPASPTLSPAPVPAAPQTPGERLAPGLERRGVVVPSALLAAHREVLVGTAYRTERVRVRAAPNGTVLSRVRTAARFDGDGAYLVTRTIDGAVTERLGTTTRVEQYADADGGVRRRVVGNGTATHSRVPPTTGPGPEPTAVLADPMAGRDVVLAFGAIDHRVTARVTGDGTRYILAGTGVRSREALRSLVGRSDVSGVSNVSLRATVSVSGLVESLSVGYDLATADGVERVERRARFGGLGRTAVERPDWVGRTASARAVAPRPVAR